MLTQITISHLVTIEKLHVELYAGTTVITGETGAGKSILIDAIELALGKRIATDKVRHGQDKADISLGFNLQNVPQAKQWLTLHELDNETDECIIRRTIHKDGRSRSFINGTPITLQLLRELTDLLINIHGQHEHQALFKQDTQRNMLDKFAGHDDLLNSVSDLGKEWHSLSSKINELKQPNHDAHSRSEFLKFQLRELEDLQLKPNEFSELDREHKDLAQSGEQLEKLNLSLQHLADQEDHNALSLLKQTLHLLESLGSENPKIVSWIENLRSNIIQLRDLEDELRSHLESIDLNPERLHWVEERISTLFNLARKHKILPTELSHFQNKILDELTAIETKDTLLEELEKKREAIEKRYEDAAAELSKSRHIAGKNLAQEINSFIQELSLPNGKFQIQFANDTARFSPQGIEKIIFEIAMNAGQPLQPLAKVASGGELSRISLAIHLATAEQHTIPSLIFDEIDVGISGGTAEIVGKLIRRLGKSHQILCITHLAQVAAQGHQHLLVEKNLRKDTTFTHVRALSTEDKIIELARMLGGVKMTQKTLEHAREMLEKN